MGDFTGTTTIDAAAQPVFDYLSEVSNLPTYFSRMTSASRTGGDTIATSAKLPNGREVQGEAWFTVDSQAMHLEWGAEGSSSYHGHLDVRAVGEMTEVEVHVHTERVADGDKQVQDGIEETLAAMKQAITAQ